MHRSIQLGVIHEVNVESTAKVLVALLLGIIQLKLYWPEMKAMENIDSEAVLFTRRSLVKEKLEDTTMKECGMILSDKGMRRTLNRLASEVSERRGDNENLVLLGIQRRGADLAERLKALLDESLGRRIPLGKIDINLYRDDWTTLNIQPSINCTEIPFDIENASIILVGRRALFRPHHPRRPGGHPGFRTAPARGVARAHRP